MANYGKPNNLKLIYWNFDLNNEIFSKKITKANQVGHLHLHRRRHILLLVNQDGLHRHPDLIMDILLIMVLVVLL